MQMDESLEKNANLKSYFGKREKLSTLIDEIEQLKIDLTLVKQEYDVRVGRLYLQLDEVNLEILKFKKLMI